MKSSRGRWRRSGSFVEALRTSLWPLPLLAVLLSLLAALGLTRLDVALDEQVGPSLSDYLFDGGPGAARSVLEAISGSLVTVTSLTFSLTVVTLQLASSQFSPRLLRTFSRDRFVHVTLSVFLATFTYSLTVLRSVRVSSESQEAFVPQLSVTVALILTLGSVVALVLFLGHLVREIRVEKMLLSVVEETRETFSRVLVGSTSDGSALEDTGLPAAPPEAVIIPATSSGFLVEVAEQDLSAAADLAGVVLSVDRLPGEFVVAGTPLARVWREPDSDVATSLDVDDLCASFDGLIELNEERTTVQDVAFGLRQLTDVAVKALSPGINDPTTAIHAIGHASALLCDASCRRLGSKVLRNPSGQIRVVLRRPELSDLLALVLGPTRRYAADDPDVLSRLLQLLREVAWSCRREHERRAVVDELERTRRTLEGPGVDEVDRSTLTVAADRVEDALRGRWPVEEASR